METHRQLDMVRLRDFFHRSTGFRHPLLRSASILKPDPEMPTFESESINEGDVCTVSGTATRPGGFVSGDSFLSPDTDLRASAFLYLLPALVFRRSGEVMFVLRDASEPLFKEDFMLFFFKSSFRFTVK